MAMDGSARPRLAIAGASGHIGSQVAALAAGAGHDVVALNRSAGVDLTDPGSVGDRLEGVTAIIDVTRPDGMDEAAATDFFTAVSTTLARAAREAAVPRTVVLSIVGIEESQDYPWYRATLAHERATVEQAPGARVLRATQFHEFPGQVLERSRDGGRAEIMDMPTQPVASAEVARTLLQMATEVEGGDRRLGGPQPEQLVELVREWCRLRGDDVHVVAVPASASMAGGSVLPGPDADLRGPTWRDWAQAEQGRA